MTVGDYFVGVVVLIVGFGALIWGSVRLREALLPAWRGAPARLAETIVAVGVAVGISEMLGVVGLFRRGPVYAGFVVFAVVVRFACPRPRPTPTANPSDEARPRINRVELAITTFGVVLVLGQWTTQVIDTFRRGMTHADTISTCAT